MKLVDDLNNMGRLEKFLCTLVLTPIILLAMLVVFVAILFLPVLALVCPNAIRFTTKKS